ncbi:MAG: hypothetical protein MUF70_08125, partial [Myxococcota bacterium]|nr:hypothetical protein [Myxococcota bacterium]
MQRSSSGSTPRSRCFGDAQAIGAENAIGLPEREATEHQKAHVSVLHARVPRAPIYTVRRALPHLGVSRLRRAGLLQVRAVALIPG